MLVGYSNAIGFRDLKAEHFMNHKCEVEHYLCSLKAPICKCGARYV